MTGNVVDNDFIRHALGVFAYLKWKPVHPEECEGPYIIAYGNIDEYGCGCVCVIDTRSNMFKIVQLRRNPIEVLKTEFIVHYGEDLKLAIQRFDHYLDIAGMVFREGWVHV